MPLLSLSKWNGEATFTIATPASLSNVSHRVYDFAPTNRDKEGGVEWEITLTKQSPSNVFAVQFTSKNLRFYYQPPLTEEFEEKDCSIYTPTHCKSKVEECHRPLEVVGSYAVYHTSRKNNKYKAGKAFHIYRPYLLDADGYFTWATLHINPQTHVLTITLPADFLASAKYPIVIDPTFGKTDIGGSSNTDATICYLSEYSLGEAGTITQLDGYFYNNNAGAEDVCCGLYDGTTLEACATGSAPGSAGNWVTCDIADTAESAGTYGLSVKPRKAAISVYYDATAADCYLDLGLVETDACPSPFVQDAGPVTRDYSVYATYTVAGVSIPVAMHHYSHHISKIIRG